MRFPVVLEFVSRLAFQHEWLTVKPSDKLVTQVKYIVFASSVAASLCLLAFRREINNGNSEY